MESFILIFKNFPYASWSVWEEGGKRMWFSGEHNSFQESYAAATPLCVVGCPHGLRAGQPLCLVLFTLEHIRFWNWDSGKVLITQKGCSWVFVAYLVFQTSFWLLIWERKLLLLRR